MATIDSSHRGSLRKVLSNLQDTIVIILLAYCFILKVEHKVQPL